MRYKNVKPLQNEHINSTKRIKTQDVASDLGVSTKTISSWVGKGYITAYKDPHKFGRQYYFDPDEIQYFVENRFKQKEYKTIERKQTNTRDKLLMDILNKIYGKLDAMHMALNVLAANSIDENDDI